MRIRISSIDLSSGLYWKPTLDEVAGAGGRGPKGRDDGGKDSLAIAFEQSKDQKNFCSARGGFGRKVILSYFPDADRKGWRCWMGA